jgi:hypothetical protein
MTTTHYTYAHYKPQGGIFYIGKGQGHRAFQFTGRNPYWNNVVNKYGKPHVEILAYWDTEAEAYSHEALLIECFKDMNTELANIGLGGIGGTTGFSHEPWNKGMPTPLEVRLKQSAAKKGKVGVRLGSVVSEETKAKIRANRPKTTLSEVGRIAISNAVKGYKHKQRTCDHCGKTGGETGMARWHFKNCRNKGELN